MAPPRLSLGHPLALIAFGCGLGLANPASLQAATFNVSSAQDIENALELAQPGDTLIMQNGDWTNQSIDFEGFGTASNPITLRAETPGGVILNGSSNLRISGDHLVVDGLHFQGGNASSAGHVVQFRGSNGEATNSRLTNSVIESYNPPDISDRYFWVSLYGEGNRVDNNRFIDQNHSGVTVVAWLDGTPANHVIEANHFADRPEGNSNGFEAIRIGTSSQATTNANVTVQNNLFERVDGEIEIISNKSNDNTYRYNTFLDSAGTLTLRHGDRATVEGNFFLGEDKDRSGGIRVVGEDHTIINNYLANIDDRADAAISIAAGVVDTPANGYQQVINALIAHNTIVDVNGAGISFDWGIGSSDRTLLPEDIAVIGNLIANTGDEIFEGYQEGTVSAFLDNLVFGAPLGLDAQPGITVADPLLVADADGLLRPSANSPAIDAILNSVVTTDFDGQPRIGLADIGADELSTAQIVRKPLSAQDVGPVWFLDGPGDPGDPGAPGDPGNGGGNPNPRPGTLVIEAENFSSLSDPDGDGNVWTVTSTDDASGGQAIQAPSGSRSDASDHDTLANYDITFDVAGTYTAYYLARGFSSSTDSFFTPDTFGVDPDNTETLVSTGEFAWETGGEFVIDEASINVPLEFRLGRREGLAEIDAIIFDLDGDLSFGELFALLETPAPEPEPDALTGDFNSDQFVAQADLDLVLLNFGATEAPEGFNVANTTDGFDDGLVGQNDLDAVLLNFGSSSAAAAVTAVPEPATAGLLGVAGAGLLVRRRRD